MIDSITKVYSYLKHFFISMELSGVLVTDTQKQLIIIYLSCENVKALDKLTLSAFTNTRNELKHWAVLFDCGHYAMKYEIDGSTGIIKPFYSVSHISSYFDIIYISAITSSPAIIHNIASQNKLTGSNYLAASQNCQDWVNVLLSDLGIPGQTTFCIKHPKSATVLTKATNLLTSSGSLSNISSGTNSSGNNTPFTTPLMNDK